MKNHFTDLFADLRKQLLSSFGILTLLLSLSVTGSLFAQAAPELPVDFEQSPTVSYNVFNFDGGDLTVIANPQSGGINTSANVAKMVKSAGQTWGGSVLPLAGPIDFSTNKIFKVKVFMPRVGAKMLLKVENSTTNSINYEKEVVGTVANAWEELTFDYSLIDVTKQYHNLVFIFDLGTMGDGSANFTFLFDDIRLVGEGTTELIQMNLPVSFDDPTVNYGVIGFEGAEASSIVEDPVSASNNVVKVIKSGAAQPWAGTTVTVVTAGKQTGFSSKVPFSDTEKRMNVRVRSPHAPIQVRLKVEDYNDPTKSVETEATLTVADSWEVLTFDFSNHVSGTEAINLALNYNKASIFFNFGVNGATAGERTYYFDDVNFGPHQVVPVELTSFAADINGNLVSLKWSTATEINNKGFEIQKSLNGSEFAAVGYVTGNGTSAEVNNYSWSEKVTNGIYSYRLKQIDFNGEFTFSSPVEVTSSGSVTPDEFALGQNYPNPFNPSTRINFSLPAASDVNLKVYNTMGQEVKTLVSGFMEAGFHSLEFNASELTSGVYYYKIQAGNFTELKKMMLIK